MKRKVKSRPSALRAAPFAIAFTLLLATIAGSLIPGVYGYNFIEHATCKGWTGDGKPIKQEEFALTDGLVYLFFNISWVDVPEYEQKWGTIPTWQRGIISAGKMTESSQLKTFNISLVDPSQAEVNKFSQRVMNNVTFRPSGCISSAFLEILNITSSTKNGRWKLKWYDGGQLVFTNEFVVGTLPAIESCDQTGARKDLFNTTETVYMNGTGHSPSTTYDIYVVQDVTWTDSMTIPARVPGTITVATSDSSGNIAPTAVWNPPLTNGRYDICVDVNQNGKYDQGIDILDDNDTQATAGYQVIPELTSFLILTLFMGTTLFAVGVYKRRSRDGVVISINRSTENPK